ncbi:hypothetical protein JCGZ_04689 [Jatropha curcas]|uniref:Uncharacterized protein n=1 Tax=Jatropha curcas TaxID=180498 RepID=A0A067KP96_JATCU|nr:mulatexin [Jatropha curcas]KDP38046.1 hypothetical protein JCGZ_04689 [Jatropha curcas]
MRSLASFMLLNVFLLIYIVSPIQGGSDSRKLDETTVPGAGGPTDEKCAPCTSDPPPPPSPPPPCPPPPALPPPPPKKPPSSNNCPPPPSNFIYITGPPGNLYPVVNDFSRGGRATPTPAVSIGFGFLVFLLRFGL